jgi:siderophore ferric iron reductase
VSEALHALVAEAARVVPGLEGRVVAADAAAPWHADAALAAVRRFWTASHPEAGPHYAALRGWGLLVWQPIYVAVIAAHLGDAQPDLDRLSIVVDDGAIGGYRLGAHAPRRSDEAGRMRCGAEQIVAGVARLLPAWQAHAPLHTKAARRTCAECVLAALLALRRRRAWSAARTHELGAHWLAALGLAGEGGFLSYRTVSGSEALALERKVCCLHFRRRDGERCSTCPKRSLPERIACLQAEG